MVPDRRVDLSGLKCPEPLMMLRQNLRSMASGEVIGVTTTDYSTLRDFGHFCEFIGHKLLTAETIEDCNQQFYYFLIQKN